MKWICRQSIPSIYAQRLLMGPKYNVATCVEELGSTKSYWRSKRLSKRVKVPNLAQAAKLELLVAVKRRERPSIPSIYAQRLLMGPTYHVATCVEELGSTKSYWRSKRLSKRVKVPNLAQAAKLELLVAVKRRERPSIPSIYAQRLLMGPTYHVATCVEELGSTKSYWRSKRLSKRVKVPNLAQAAKLELLVAVKRRERPSIPSIYAQRLLMGPTYHVATCVEELGSTKSYWRSKRLSKRVKVPNLAQAAKSELLVAVKRRERPSIPSIYAQRLLMGPTYHVATCVEELGSTKSYWRSKRLSKRVKVPNLAQAAKSELLVAVKRRERPSIPSIYAQRLLMGPTYHVATCVEELGSTKSYWRSKRLSKRVKVPNLAQAAKSELLVAVKRRERPSIPSIYAQRLLMGLTYYVATCIEELGSTKSYWRSKRLSKRVKVPNLAQAAKSELLVAVKWRERPSIPSIYAQRLLIGLTYYVATCIEELGSTKSYWRSKHLSKRVKVPNLARAADSELLVDVKWRET